MQCSQIFKSRIVTAALAVTGAQYIINLRRFPVISLSGPRAAQGIMCKGGDRCSDTAHNHTCEAEGDEQDRSTGVAVMAADHTEHSKTIRFSFSAFSQKARICCFNSLPEGKSFSAHDLNCYRPLHVGKCFVS